MNSLTTWLNESKVASVRGARWASTAVRNIVSSPRIAGLRAYKGDVVSAPGIATQLASIIETT
ncbi:recombinase family protein [Mycobacteroides abscessus]|uniref:recombinase family protein n=1 Tax=Mycobacteroides abscessus TaxID=36809 RepID=UPI0039A0DD90